MIQNELKSRTKWWNTWYTILNSIHGSINQDLETIDEKLKKKINT